MRRHFKYEVYEHFPTEIIIFSRNHFYTDIAFIEFLAIINCSYVLCHYRLTDENQTYKE